MIPLEILLTVAATSIVGLVLGTAYVLFELIAGRHYLTACVVCVFALLPFALFLIRVGV